MAAQRTQGITPERWERIKSIFEAALEQPACDRSSFVSRICGEDESIRSEVESLLSGHEQAGSFMVEPAIAALASDWGRSPEDRTFQRGDMISGRFEILRFIAEGGMGEVYAARDVELAINVALKTIRPKIASDPQTLARFKQELHLSRRISHSNVCRVFDLAHHRITGANGSPERDVTFLTMELLEGETLAERLRRGRISPAEALPLIQQMAEGLDAAHSVGVIHRDFKPSNVILCSHQQPTGAEPGIRVVITDFGLAHSVSADVSASLTHSGQILGTLAYMAPEQVEGKEVTPAADIYALGLVMYEMVTGSRPFPADAPLGGVIQRLKEPPPAPRILVPDIDQAWEATVLQCLQPEPENRFARANEVVPSLQSASSSSVLRHSFKVRLQSLRTWSTAQRLYVLSGGLFVLLLAIWLQRGKSSLSSNAVSGPPMKLEMTQFTADGGVTFQPSVSRDGKEVVYSSDRGGTGILNLWIQDMKGGIPRQITHELSDAVEPTFSPDGKWIAFHLEGDGGLYVISATGDNRHLAAPKGHQPQFSPDGGQLLYWSGDWFGDLSNPSFSPTAAIYLVPTAGGYSKRLQGQFVDARCPGWSPDGRHIMFLGTQTAAGSTVDVSDWWTLDTDDPNDPPIQTGIFKALRKYSIVTQEFPLRWWNDSVIFAGRMAQSTNLFQIRLSRGTFNVSGEPQRLTFGTAYETAPSVSLTGQLFFTSENASVNVWALPLSGSVPRPHSPSSLMQLTSAASIDTRPSISSDGKKLAFARRWGADRNVWFKDLRTGAETPLTSSLVTSPVISRDGSAVAYSLYSEPNRATIEVISTATASEQHICPDCGDPLDWSNDGTALLYSSGHPRNISLWDINSNTRKVLVQRGGDIRAASFCPNDRCIVFAESLDGVRAKVWLAGLKEKVVSPPDRWLPITDGQHIDDKPRVGNDGKWVYFYSNRDGFSCLWKLRVDLRNWTLFGSPVPTVHLHRATFSLHNLSLPAFDLRLAVDKLVFNAVSDTANIWTTRLQR